MNELSPELKRLMRWSRRAPEPLTPPMPFGFSTRVVASWDTAAPEGEFDLWQRAIRRSAWVAAGLILLELALLSAQQFRPSPSYDITPAYQVVSTEFVP